MFDIIGPVMIGPSSSHTAGASRSGLIARRLLGEEPKKAHITLYGSFALTAQGHGVDRAIVGGILGFELDDERIRESFSHAEDAGLEVSIEKSDEDVAHPNTARIELTGTSGAKVNVLVRSVGGGVVNVTEIDGGEVMFSAQYDTTVIFNNDRPGTIANITEILADEKINIAYMRVFRKSEGRSAVMVIETDQSVSEAAVAKLRVIDNVVKVITVPPFNV